MKDIDFKSLIFDLEDMSRVNNSIWFPSESDKEIMSQSIWDQAMAEYTEAVDNLVFNNIQVIYDSCDCYGGCCGHPSWVHELHVRTPEGLVVITMEEDQLCFPFNETYIFVTPTEKFTYADFIAICKFCNINLESNLYNI